MPCCPRPGYTRLPPPSHPPPHPCRGRQPVEEPRGTVQVRMGVYGYPSVFYRYPLVFYRYLAISY